MDRLIFLGTDFKKGKGGVASVLNEYSKIFPNAIFINTTASKGKFENLMVLIRALIMLPFVLIFNRNAIVHIHGASYTSFYRKYLLFQLIRTFGNKLVYHIHGGGFHNFYKNENKKGQLKIAYLIKNVDCIICLSKQWETFFKENFNPKMIKIIPNIIETPKNIEVKSNDQFNFLFLGHISKNKGIWLLLEVIKEYKEKLGGKAIFYIGGNGETEKLVELINSYGLENIVEFIGWVSKDKKIEYLNKSDVYILPSYNEGLPISILEAMSYELPIISTNVGGIPEIVDSKNGILIEPANKEQLKEAMVYIINHSEFRKKAGEVSYQRSLPHFPENVKKELEKLYYNL